jgi:regulator of protease activity HflC (stomatin/prohibitin superfamily)
MMIKEIPSRFIKHISRQLLAWRNDIWLIGLAIILVFALMLPIIVVTIPAGNVGVEWRRFQNGTVTGPAHGEGIVLIKPWDQLYLYDTRVKVGEDRVGTLSADGLTVEVDLAWQYHILPEAAGIVHKFLGPDYGEAIVGRVVTSVVRTQMAAYRSEDLHSGERLNFEKSVAVESNKALKNLEAIKNLSEFKNNPDFKWVILEAVLIKDVKFPQGVQEAYVRKNTARALVDEYTYKIAAEQKEVERKRTEALGIRGFQEIVSTGLSDSYLKWRGIDATLQLSQSNNAKVVVIGGGSSGMPLILNTNSEEIKNSSAAKNKEAGSKNESVIKGNPKTGTP